MTGKRPSKRQLKRDRSITSTLLTKPIEQCNLDECLRLRAFYSAALKYLGVNSATVTKLSAQKKPSRRAIAGAISRAA
jgi:hypothetical protein